MTEIEWWEKVEREADTDSRRFWIRAPLRSSDCVASELTEADAEIEYQKFLDASETPTITMRELQAEREKADVLVPRMKRKV